MDRWIGKIIGNAILIFFSSSLMFAQTPPIDKDEFWSRIQVMSRLSKRWIIGIDYQYRRQQIDHHFLDIPLLQSYRTWANFELPHNFQLISNPVMYLEHYRINEGSDWEQNPVVKLHELRTVWGVQHELELNKIELRNRLLGEFRWMNFDKKESSFLFRWRYQFLFAFLLTRLSTHSRMNIQLFDEIFFQPETVTIPNTYITKHHVFEQNRVALSLLTTVYAVELQLGFQYTYQLSGFRIYNKYQLLTGLVIRI
ncbi:MAG: DUF2490 domain-containing protein [Flavobacteriales bacterium]|nr:DUF2490 domain-containing protein [Flavobacteriales bacterium]